MDRPSLRDVIRRKLDNGTFRPGPQQDACGFGEGRPCDACGDPTLPGQIAYAGDRPDQMHTFRMPVGCAGLWEAVRLHRRLDPAF
jgi:hypothetical protein